MSDHILVEHSGAVLRLQLNRPAKKNALTSEMYGALADGLAEAAREDSIHVVLITGVPGTFCAGNDLRAFVDPMETGEQVRRFLEQISTCPKPLVAAVDGLAIGIGTTLLLHCDYVVAAKEAYFKMPFTELALVPEAASSLIVPGLLGQRVAGEILLMSEPFGAEQALGWGIVNRVVESAELEEAGLVAASRLAELPAASVQATKRLLREPMAAAVKETMQCELKVFSERLASPEFREAMERFKSRKS
jgi:enoyl-CoA hydratase/carnithine racemase